jgi:hypothetical protein
MLFSDFFYRVSEKNAEIAFFHRSEKKCQNGIFYKII